MNCNILINKTGILKYPVWLHGVRQALFINGWFYQAEFSVFKVRPQHF
jgi:hypothetical protein